MRQASHSFQLLKQKPTVDLPSGRRFDAVKKTFPVLDGMSAYLLELLPGCFREPHWHPNTVELTYCLKGRARITFFMHGSLVEDFLVEEGDLFFVPRGFMHAIENLDQGTSRFLILFAHESPEDFGLSGFYGAMPKEIIADIFKVEQAKRSAMPKGSARDILIAKGEGSRKVGKQVSRYKLAFEAEEPLLKIPAGLVKVARTSTFPILEKIAVYSLHLNQEGIREPHWHPNCAEMGYVNRGAGRLIIQFPDGGHEAFVAEEGDLYFIPAAYPHYIEPIDEKGLHFVIAFNATMPQDIGISGILSAFDPAIVAPTLGTDQDHLKLFKQFDADLLIAESMRSKKR